jgi:hypothetical protein
LIAASVVVTLFLVLTQHIHGAANVLSAIHRAKNKDGQATARPSGASVVVGDKVIVMAKLRHEDTDWVEEHLPEYAYPFASPSMSISNVTIAGNEQSTPSMILIQTPSTASPRTKATNQWHTSHISSTITTTFPRP